MCGHLMKVCGRTPSKDEEHEEHYEFQAQIQVSYHYIKLNDDAVHVFESLMMFLDEVFRERKQSAAKEGKN